MKLIKPSLKYKESYIQALKEFHSEGRNLNLVIEEIENNFSQYIEGILGLTQGKGLKKGYVPETKLWLLDNEEVIGTVSIRHRLTPQLLRVGGHIGYEIKPSKRGQGYGTKLLKMAMEEAKKLGIEDVLITCDQTNEASKKVIEANGGKLENIEEQGEGKVAKLRYWINL